MENGEVDNGQVDNEGEPVSRGDLSDFNFWEINSYKKTVKRIDDGARLCDEFMKMVSERAEIESTYYSKMKAWSKKWEDNHKKGPEYGALKTAMYGIMLEGEQLADIHYELRERLMNDVFQSLNQWKKDNYHKSLMSYKEVKNAEEGFSKAQKPWFRRVDEVNKCKKSYYNSCRNLDNGKRQHEEGIAKAGLGDDQLRKLQDKVSKYDQEVTTSREKYKEALRDLTGYIGKYQEDMKYQFNKCQELEKTRKYFFDNLLIDYHKTVNREKYMSRMTVIYQTLLETLKKTNTENDLDWFARVYGVQSKMETPEYEEYDPNIALSTGGANTSPSSGRINSNDSGDVQKSKRSSVCTTL